VATHKGSYKRNSVPANGKKCNIPYTIKPISEHTHFNSEDGACTFLATSISAQNTTSATIQKTMILTITTVKISKLKNW
jgi:hypothetical protein